jgi:F-type H+-transporting ATPase subunit b
MDEILQQLVPLLIGSVPTMILFLFLVLAYKYILHTPLLKVLAERRQRTLGAVEKANEAIAAADAKAQEYEARLRAAKAEIYRAREHRVKAWAAERETALNTARQAARERVLAATSALDTHAEVLKLEIERGSDDLAAHILKAVLPPASNSGNTLLAEGSR